jgi:hypothetical protein
VFLVACFDGTNSQRIHFFGLIGFSFFPSTLAVERVLISKLNSQFLVALYSHVKVPARPAFALRLLLSEQPAGLLTASLRPCQGTRSGGRLQLAMFWKVRWATKEAWALASSLRAVEYAS